MSNMSVLELFQGVFWGLGGSLPLILAFQSGEERAKKDDFLMLMVLSNLLQIFIIIVAYKAGGK